MFILLLFNLFINLPDSTLVKYTDYNGFANAVSMTTDGKGFIYILDNENNEVIKFDENLKEVKRTGRKGWNNGEFDSPTNIDGSSGLDIYVTDGINYRIQRFDLNLSFVSSLITNSETFDDKLKFNTPIASVILNSSDLYVIDGENKRIVYFKNGKTPFLSFGGFQSAEKPLISPAKILRDSFNYLYVLDKKQQCVFQYDNFGNYIKIFTIPEIKTFTIYNNCLYFVTESEILIYDLNKNAYSNRIGFIDNSKKMITDMLVYNGNKFLFLQKTKIEIYLLK